MSVVRALVYLQATTVLGLVRQRLRRLKQPKYLVGALAGAAYLYFFMLRPMLSGARGTPRLMHLPPEFAQVAVPLGALGLLVVAFSAWIFPSDRAALRFSEAETSFLFPAPITRTGLIHFSVLRAQLVLFVSVFLISLLLRRGRAMGINPLQYATALWLMAATLRLHFLGASFTRERLLDLGVRPAWRRAGALALAVLLAAACIAWACAHAPPPDLVDLRGLATYVGSALGSGPAYWVLAPFRALVAPIFATSSTVFLKAAPVAAALLLLHYAWVVAAQVSFEEASIAQAKRRTETVRAMREGRMRIGNGPKRARKAPFVLAPQGFAPIAFLWKDLLAAGPLWRLRSAVIAAVVIVAGTQWIARLPAAPVLLQVVGVGALAIAGWSGFVGPMIAQGRLRRSLDHLDVLRATPLRGWQIALGQLLAPVAMLVGVQALLLLAAACAYVRVPDVAWLTPGVMVAGGVAVLLVAPLVCALMLCVPFAGMLVFPGWSGSGRGGGIDVMGQRLIFGGAYLLALVIALLPAAAVSGLVVFLLRLFAGWPVAGTIAAVVGAAVLAVEVGLMLRWLGGRIERFDVSTEMR
ncbi:putative ABC exporter domain-containing protein [Lysobacter xanthus]